MTLFQLYPTENLRIIAPGLCHSAGKCDNISSVFPPHNFFTEGIRSSAIKLAGLREFASEGIYGIQEQWWRDSCHMHCAITDVS